MDNILKPMSYARQMEGSLFSWKTSLLLYHTMKECQVANCHGQASDAYAYVWMMQCSLFSRITLWNLCHTLNRCKVAYFHGILHDSYTMQWRNVMDNTLKPMSYTEQMEGSLFSWETSWNLYHVLKECQVANFHGQASDAYADVWMMQGSLFSLIRITCQSGAIMCMWTDQDNVSEWSNNVCGLIRITCQSEAIMSICGLIRITCQSEAIMFICGLIRIMCQSGGIMSICWLIRITCQSGAIMSIWLYTL
jgi:hypothetical protein